MIAPIESTSDRAAQAVHMAVADFFVAISTAKTNAEALALRNTIGVLVLSLGAAEDAAGQKADTLCG